MYQLPTENLQQYELTPDKMIIFVIDVKRIFAHYN